MKKLLMILVAGLILFVGVSVAEARNQFPPCPSQFDCSINDPIEEPIDEPTVSRGFSGGLLPGADQCKSDESVIYGDWSVCQANFGPSGLMTRSILGTTNGCKPTAKQMIMTIRSCETTNVLGGYGYLYGTDWLK